YHSTNFIYISIDVFFFFFSSRRRHTRWPRDWSSDVCSSDLDLVSASQDEATKIIQSIYGEPIKEELIHRRIHEIKKGGGPAVVRSEERRVGKECRSRRWKDH